MAFGFLKKIVKGVGKVAKKAAPIVVLIPGVGTIPAALLGGVGGLAAGEGLKGALTGAAGGAAGGLAGGALRKLGAGKALGGLFGGGAPNLGDLAKLGIAGAGVVQSAQQQGKANKLLDQYAQQEAALQAQRAPLQQLFSQGIQKLPTQGPDLGGLFQTANPFARPGTPQPAMAGIPAQPLGYTPLEIGNQPLAMPDRSRIQGRTRRLGGLNVPTRQALL